MSGELSLGVRRTSSSRCLRVESGTTVRFRTQIGTQFVQHALVGGDLFFNFLDNCVESTLSGAHTFQRQAMHAPAGISSLVRSVKSAHKRDSKFGTPHSASAWAVCHTGCLKKPSSFCVGVG